MRLHRPRATTVAALSAVVAVALAGNTVSYAAGGPSLVLGAKNSAAGTTTLKARHGSPLNLLAKDGSAPLRVGSNTKVEGLNADLLDGQDAQAIQDGAVARAVPQAVASAVPQAVAGATQALAPRPVLRVAPWGLADADVISSKTVTVTVPTGAYLISLQGLLAPVAGSTSDSYTCSVEDKLRAHSGDRSAISAPYLVQAGNAGSALGAVDQQVYAELDAARPLEIGCTFEGATRQIKPVQVLLQPLAVTELAPTS